MEESIHSLLRGDHELISRLLEEINQKAGNAKETSELLSKLKWTLETFHIRRKGYLRCLK